MSFKNFVRLEKIFHRHLVKLLFLLLLFFFLSFGGRCQKTIAQKPLIDSSAFSNWPEVDYVSSSPNRNYACYRFGIDMPLHIVSAVTHLVTRIDNNTQGFQFLHNNRQAVYERKDSLFVLNLATGKPSFVVRCSSFEIIGDHKEDWLIYKTPADGLTIRKGIYGKEVLIDDAKEYQYVSNQSFLLLTLHHQNGKQELVLVHLPDMGQIAIWHGEKLSSGISVDLSGKGLAFISTDRANTPSSRTIWYYNIDTQKIISLLQGSSTNLTESLLIKDKAPEFSKDGKYILFYLEQPVKELPPINPSLAKVNVWHYQDIVLQSEQKNRSPTSSAYLAAIDTAGGKLVCIERPGDSMTTGKRKKNDVLAIIRKPENDKPWFVDPEYIAPTYLISLEDGAVKLKLNNCINVNESPNGKFITWFDLQRQAYYSYDIARDSIINCTKDIFVPLGYDGWDVPGRFPPPPGVLFLGYDWEQEIFYWLTEDKGFIIFDNYDLWLVDPGGKSKPLNLTNGYGRLHNLQFIFAENEYARSYELKAGDEILLSAFDRQKKQMGFYKIKFGTGEYPKALTIGPYEYRIQKDDKHSLSSVLTKNEKWIVMRQSATEAPNLFYTIDFIHFDSLTDVHPQKMYNWLTSEILQYELPDGRVAQAILYKPENFDPNIKYPVLFSYYQKRSQNAFKFLKPEWTYQEINIPYFVSRGYLVCVPDIYYHIGTAGDDAVASITAAVSCLKPYPFVDLSKMGINGCSWGGYETLYFITHCHLFAAAAEMSGLSDFTTNLNDISYSGHYMNPWQDRLGVFFGEHPEVVIKNSPLFSVKNVTTPLLMVHNPKDDQVPWKQGLEFYMAMRSLQKPVWMLEYDEGEHALDESINDGRDAKDYTIRLTHFFDHYLKGAPPPRWMTEGVPAELKQRESGYELMPGK